MKERLIDRIKREGIVDTKRYRYMYDAKTDDVLYIPLDELDTTAALHEFNGIEGWRREPAW